MSRNAWIIVLVALVIVVGVALAMSHKGMYAPDSTASSTAPYGVATDTNNATLPTGTSTSDASLNTDFQSMDSQMAGFYSDNTAASQSVDSEQNGSAQ